MKLQKKVKWTTKTFIAKCTEIHKGKFNYSKVNYTKNHEKVRIICPKHGLFTQRASGHLTGIGCKKCADEKLCTGSLTTYSQYMKKVKQKHGEKYSYIKDSYIYNPKTKRTHIKFVCKEHGIMRQRAYEHLHTNGCIKCANIIAGKKRRHDTATFLKKAKEIHGDLYDYSKAKYISNIIEVTIICKKHGEFKQNPNWHISGRGMCPLCKSSNGEQVIARFLTKYNINYKREFIITESGNKFRYDFYLPEMNILIEYDGIQHYYPIDNFGGVKQFNKIQEHDKIKNKKAKEFGYKLLRIKYTKFKILEGYLAFRLGFYYKYRYRNVFYKNKKDLLSNKNFNSHTELKDLTQYLLFNKRSIQ